MKFVDLCAGTGAFTHVLEKLGCECVYANDYSKDSETAYNLNFKHKLDHRDLCQVDEIPKHDILTAGSPCQPWSVAGLKKGFDDQRTNVFWKIIKIIQDHRPKLFLIENVKGLHEKALDKLLGPIKEYYKVSHKLLDTCKITHIPQHRERIYIVGIRKDLPPWDPFENILELQNRPISTFLESKIDQRYYYSNRFKAWDLISNGVTKHIDTNTVYQYRRTFIRENKSNVCPTLTANMGTGGHNVPLIRDSQGVRKLTPRECFNLQGFPKSYKFGKLSDSKLYKLVGNSVTLDVIMIILEGAVENLG